jgi:Ca2+-binding EF-hand superfamily protein
VERFRVKLLERGSRGLISLARTFRMMDTDNSGALDLFEFAKCIQDFGLKIDPKDIQGVFKSFDSNKDGVIRYDEFINTVKG